MTCQRCGRESASALYCTWCGTRQGAEATSVAGRRGDRFAAHPNEAVLEASVFTTLFPHLGHHKISEFRWATLIGAGIIGILYLAGLITAAILMGAILVPVVYLLYLYEVRVYRDAPIPVLALTLGAGVVVGVIVTLIVDALASTAPLMQSTPFGLTIDGRGVLLFLVAVPIVVEIVKPLPTLLLRRSGSFPETIDGLVFGVAAGLGFAAAETLVHFSQVITSGLVQRDPGNWIYPLLTITIFMPLMHGSATGLVAGAAWRFGRQGGRLTLAAVAAAVVGHIAFVLGTELAGALGLAPIVPLVWQGLVVGALLIAVRLLLHHALLDEAADLGLSQGSCPNCDSHVTAAGFCPVCGMAMTAVPRALPDGPRGVSPASAEGA